LYRVRLPPTMSAPSEGFVNLQRVVLAEPEMGEAIQILALELYEDGVAVRWGSLPSGSGAMPQIAEEAWLDPVQLLSLTYGAFPSDLPRPLPETVEVDELNPFGLVLTLRDDLQTSYELAGSSGGMLLGKTYFTPAIPPGATWLEVVVEYGIVRFEL
jgi:hypothetical protein